MMKRILLPTDFSDNSWNAIKYALQLFQSQECHFILLNTYTPIIFQWEHTQSGSAQIELFDEMKTASNEGLDRILEKIGLELPNSKHQFSKVSSFNTLPLEIEEMYHDPAPEMIVMGTKGASGVKRVLFGSNTIHVLKNAKCPILAIPSHFAFEVPEELLFPTDYNMAFTSVQLQPLLDMVATFGTRINVLHVNDQKALTQEQLAHKNKLAGLFEKGSILFHEVQAKNVPEAIAEFQIKSKIDILVMFKNKHSFFTNLFYKPTIDRIGFHLNVPFLVIPVK